MLTSPGTTAVALMVALSVARAAFAQACGPAGPVVTRRAIGREALVLHRDAAGDGSLVRVDANGREHPVRCELLRGAWGLWVDDVDGDGRVEALVALHKRARFDPVVENRLHVYALVDDRCVPLWRGTRLAGRFDSVATTPDAPGTLFAFERLGRRGHRVARYRWDDFGYTLDRVVWAGRGALPARLRSLFDTWGPSP